MEKGPTTVSAMEAFEKLEKVGEGTYGKVYRAREKATGKIVALKKTRLHEDEEGVPPTTLREVSILRMLSRDPHIVRLMDVKQGQNKEGKTVLYLVFEYMDTDLKKFIKSFRHTGESIPVNTVKSLMYQLCKGVAFCHGHGILHRDLKPHNLLMDRKTMMLKIADLGLARAFTLPIKKYTHEAIVFYTWRGRIRTIHCFILTLWYRAPEVLLGATHYSTAVDMWSVGCIFGIFLSPELATKQALFPGDSELQQLLHIFRLLGTPNEKVWPGVSKLMNWHEYPQWNPQSLSTAVPNLDDKALDLLAQMLKYEPSKRISAKRAMEHPYFDDLNKAYL
ncbi:Cyclin-dependent kinase B2-2 [Cucurbita argyrosperma subsp. argyrosperma]|nr:Cyclin-dependent kinase B2-2 [Cucurbita argyrosperma subsp. argyrosperma]